jgi:hypothetical protein
MHHAELHVYNFRQIPHAGIKIGRDCLIGEFCLIRGQGGVTIGDVVDSIAERMGWEDFQQLLRDKQPRYYVTQVTAPTLTNDMYGTLLARSGLFSRA